MLARMRDEGKEADPRGVVVLLVRPLANSIAAGEMFVPFLARLSEDPRARVDYWPDHLEDEGTQERLEELVDAALQGRPERIRRGRTFQLYIGLISVLAAAARSGRGMSEAQLHNYVDTWVGMLTAAVSYETRALRADSLTECNAPTISRERRSAMRASSSPTSRSTASVCWPIVQPASALERDRENRHRGASRRCSSKIGLYACTA